MPLGAVGQGSGGAGVGEEAQEGRVNDWLVFAWGVIVGCWIAHGFHIFIVRGGSE